MPRKFIGKYLSFTFEGRKREVAGVLLDYNDDYTLIRNIVDYTPDGYYIFKNHKVGVSYGEREKFAAKVLKAKNYSARKEPLVPLDSLDAILNHISKKYKLIQLNTKKGDACDIVRYLGQKGNKYSFRYLTTTAKWRYRLELPERECRFIQFDNNYVNSLKRVAKF